MVEFREMHHAFFFIAALKKNSQWTTLFENSERIVLFYKGFFVGYLLHLQIKGKMTLLYFVISAHEKSLVPWVDDSMVPLCPDCGKSFNLSRRKHHCRCALLLKETAIFNSARSK